MTYTTWLRNLLSLKNTGSELPYRHFVKSCWCPRAAIYSCDEKTGVTEIQPESIEPVIGSEETENRSPIILKNLLCSTQLGSGSSTIFPYGFRKTSASPVTRVVEPTAQGKDRPRVTYLHHGQRGRPYKLILTRLAAHQVPSSIKLLASFVYSTNECNLDYWATGDLHDWCGLYRTSLG